MTARHFFVGLILALLIHLAGVRLFPEFPRWVDVFLVLVVLNGLEGRSASAMFGGLFCGLIHDVLSGGLFGLYGFADTLTGYATALVARRLVTHRSAGVLAVFVLSATLQRATLYALDFALLAGSGLPSLPWALLPIATTSLLGLIVHASTARAMHRLRERRRHGSGRLRGKD